MIAASRLRHRVEIQRQVRARDPSTGAVSTTWQKIDDGDEWVGIEPLSTREFVAAAAVNSKITARIIMRYRADVTAAMRVVAGAKVYSIEGPPLPDKESGLEYITLAVSEGANKGA